MSTNTDAPVGLWPRQGVGGDATPRMRQYTIASGYLSAIGLGGPLELLSDGTVRRLTANATSNIIGVAAHFVSRTGTGRTVMVFDNPDTLFEIQVADGVSIASVADCIGANFSLVNFNTYNSTNQRSICEIGAAGSSAIAARPVRCISVSRRIDKDEFSNSWIGLIVQINPSWHVFGKAGSISNTV